MKTQEQRDSLAAYMREYTAKNKDVLNARRNERRKNIMECDPNEHARRLDLARKRNARYYANGGDHVKKLKLDNQKKNHTTEKAKAKRDKYKFSYATKTSIKSARNMAKDYGLPFDLDEEWFDIEFAKGCAATGLPLDKNGSKTPFTVNIDRVVPAVGYVKSNCRLVCACFNKAKWTRTDDEVIKMARALIAKADADA